MACTDDCHNVIVLETMNPWKEWFSNLSLVYQTDDMNKGSIG